MSSGNGESTKIGGKDEFLFGMLHVTSGRSGEFQRRSATNINRAQMTTTINPFHTEASRYDAASANHCIHVEVTCDRCKVSPIRGIRYRCSMCPNYDLCEDCIAEHEQTSARDKFYSFHDKTHLFLRVASPCNDFLRYPIVMNRAGTKHTGVTCTVCRRMDPEGYLYKCQQCIGVNLCESCEAKGLHDPGHPRLKLSLPSAESELARSKAEIAALQAQLMELKEKNAVTGPWKKWGREDSSKPMSNKSVTCNLRAVSAEELSLDEIMAILVRENELRLSQDTQRRFRNISKQPDGWLSVVEDLQLQVAKEFNLPNEIALKVMRSAETLVPTSEKIVLEQIKQISLYRKYNRCIDSHLEVGDMPPNISLVHSTSTSSKVVTLHSILERNPGRSNRNRPLVIFAGSYTWPPFRALLPKIKGITSAHDDDFDFIGIYIEEAHAIDEWPIAEAPRAFHQHRTLQERLHACQALLDDYGEWIDFEFYVDTMDNGFNTKYSSWPFRYWVMTREQIIFKAYPQNASYDLGELESFLSSMQKHE